MTTFTVPGPPVPWARARRAGSRYFVDAKTAAHKQKIAHAARKAGAVPVDGPVRVDLVYCYSSGVTTVEVRPLFSGKDTRPDIDNLIKLVFDALNGVCWRDDGQVAIVMATKIAKQKKKRTRIDA